MADNVILDLTNESSIEVQEIIDNIHQQEPRIMNMNQRKERE
jgi:hypothetical protein